VPRTGISSRRAKHCSLTRLVGPGKFVAELRSAAGKL
jgi:hypothetical protein